MSAATNTRKQSAVTFEVFVLWLRNQHYYTRDAIGIKMMYRMMTKTRHEYKLHKNKHKNHTNCLHTFRRWSIPWSQVIVSGSFKRWLICHSMASTAIYSSRGCGSI